MNFTTYVRKPFTVEAIQITRENIEEAAPFIGTLIKEGPNAPYILVNSEKVPNVEQVYPGFWMTRMGKFTRCYSRRAFENEFVEQTPVVAEMVAHIHGNVQNVPPEKEEAVETTG